MPRSMPWRAWRAGRALLAVSAALAVVPAGASPTAHEFQRCHREAAALLQFCLDEQPGARHGPACWDRSRQQQQACYRAVQDAHSAAPRRPTVAPTGR